MWWATQFLGGTMTSLVGEFFCMRYEMREISIVALAGTGGGKGPSGGGSNAQGGGAGGAGGTDAVGGAGWKGRLKMAFQGSPMGGGRNTHPPSPAAADNDETESLLRSTASSPARLGALSLMWPPPFSSSEICEATPFSLL